MGLRLTQMMDVHGSMYNIRPIFDDTRMLQIHCKFMWPPSSTGRLLCIQPFFILKIHLLHTSSGSTLHPEPCWLSQADALYRLEKTLSDPQSRVESQVGEWSLIMCGEMSGKMSQWMVVRCRGSNRIEQLNLRQAVMFMF